MMDAILFDMDGVILNSMPYHVKAWQEAFREFGMEVPSKLLYLYEGAIEPQNAVELFRRNGCCISTEDFSKILQRQKEIFKLFKREIRPFPEIPRILQRLNEKGVSTALVTSSHKDVLANTLPKWLIPHFKCIITGDEVTRRKPHPDPYLKAVDHVQVDPKRCIAIENAPAGIESAKKAGIRCIAIETTLSEDYLAMADLVVRDHKELIHAIDI